MYQTYQSFAYFNRERLMTEPLEPIVKEGEFKTAQLDVPQSVPLAFEKCSFFRDDVLLEQNAD